MYSDSTPAWDKRSRSLAVVFGSAGFSFLGVLGGRWVFRPLCDFADMAGQVIAAALERIACDNPLNLNVIGSEVLDREGTVLIDDGRRSSLFQNPVEVLVAHDQCSLTHAIARGQQALKDGFAVAGFLTYDAGIPWVAGHASRHNPDSPLAWFGIYPNVEWIEDLRIAGPPASVNAARSLNIDEERYVRRVQRIKQAIGFGDAYQVNFTLKMRTTTDSPASALFAKLRNAHPVGHSAFINGGDHQVLSLSPELFLRRSGESLLTRPMKGTIRRGRWLEEDQAMEDQLRDDPKSRAENLMIVDLMRNDLGKTCQVGSIAVPRLFAVERYRSVLQMTSDVEGRIEAGVTMESILRATFPPGSVTGAPKSRAVALIDELEDESRGVYCGTLGAFFPNGDFVLNVAIRTLVQRGTTLELGIGSGIVWDSDPRAEWQEVLLKSTFLDAAPPDFRLFETMRKDANGHVPLFSYHRDRLARSAQYFGFSLDADAATERVRCAASSGVARLRMTLNREGELDLEASPLDQTAERSWLVRLSPEPVDSSNPMWFHKTTMRTRYDCELAEARASGFDEVLHINERVELTEGCITNLLIQMDGSWFTPPLECGLLPGVYRQKLLSEGRIQERVLLLTDLASAQAVRLCNAVRGEVEVANIEGHWPV